MQVSSRLAAVGMGVLVLAFTGSVLLVVDVTANRVLGAAAGGGTMLVCLGLWGLLPRMVRRAGLAEERAASRKPAGPRRPPAPRGPSAPERLAAPRASVVRREPSMRRL